MGDECVPALNVLALVVAFLRFIRNLKATAGVGSMSTQRAIHHNRLSILNFQIMITLNAIFLNYSASKSSIFTSSSSAVVKPLSLIVLVTVVMIQSASSICCLNPLTFTGSSGNNSSRPIAN